jgi:hypothetical protein
MQYQEEAHLQSRERRRPKRQRNRIRTLVDLILSNDLLRVSEAELSTMLATAPREELLALSSDIANASTRLRTFAGRVQDRIGTMLETQRSVPQRSTPPPAPAPPRAKEPPEVKAPAARQKPQERPKAAMPARREAPKPRRIVSAQPRNNVPHGVASQIRVSAAPRPDPAFSQEELLALTPRPIKRPSADDAETDELTKLRQLFRAEVNVQAWITNSGRFGLVTVRDPETYLKLFREKAFKYQREGTERPEHYPDPEMVASLLAK